MTYSKLDADSLQLVDRSYTYYCFFQDILFAYKERHTAIEAIEGDFEATHTRSAMDDRLP